MKTLYDNEIMLEAQKTKYKKNAEALTIKYSAKLYAKTPYEWKKIKHHVQRLVQENIGREHNPPPLKDLQFD